ncbi:C-type lectin domain family 10 member A MMGL [Triplophysa tibetana]|uniref:C-type lectin domain family 10 member A MMGL n=1 Tax=Triplophysa tibetana TaxID=1572043 RepID=A0A5A9PDZ1_9TELE|nr:C-type lectin domain family 10 member A MMGL [Triplophysa tibetana]
MFSLVFFSAFITYTLCVPRHYIFVNENKTWTEAQSYCRDKYTDLVTLENAQETVQLLNTVNDYNSLDLAWIGLYDDLNSWKWTLEDSDFFKEGEKHFRNWYSPGPVRYGENICVSMYNAWYEKDCNLLLTSVCYDGRENASAGYVFISLYQTWKQAQSYCREHHTDLVSIRNEYENQKIQHVFPDFNNFETWIGLYGTRSWSDLSNSTFTFWKTGEPDNAGYCTAVLFSDSGKWTDENCNYEIPFVCYSDLAASRQYHFISVNKSWSEAQTYCRQNYIDLATIDNMTEMDSVMNTVNGSYDGSAWIGQYDDVNSWRWSLDDDDFYQEGQREFRNWYHEPDNYGGNELCVYMNYDGKWFDASCSKTLSFVCYENGTHSYIKITDERNWTDARRYCREHHTDLVNVRNETENQKILESAGGGVWIGLYRNRIWSDNQISSYLNWRPGIQNSPKQPDNGANIDSKPGNQRCTAVSFRYSGRWTDENCFSNMPFICYNRTCTQSSCNTRQYHFISESKSWSEAQRYCRQNYIDLATIDNITEMNHLIKTLRGIYFGSAWIGLYDDLNNWRWSLGNTELGAGFNRWNVLQPTNWNGQSLCVSMTFDRGWWIELDCFIHLSFVCYDGRQNASESYVYVDEYKTWTEAQSYCREHHTNLVSIRDEIESLRIHSLIPIYSYVWIGLYRTRSWSDQSNSTFSNWKTGEPNNAGGSEHCTAVSVGDADNWTDENCNYQLPFICHSVSSLASSRQYHFISVNKSWSEAQTYCRQNYTDLATIDNMTEMNSVMNTVNGSYNGSAWIGQYDDVNSWRWSLDDDDFYQGGEREFRNWFHEPNNYLGNELCVVLDYNGNWADISCESSQSFICYDGRANTSQNYVLVLEGKTWSEAQRHCREFYTDLAIVRNETEHQQILDITVFSGYVYVWIGLYRNSRWSDQSNSTFTYWLPETSYVPPQPDNGLYGSEMQGTQHCTAVSLQSFGQWTDESCLERLPFFCYDDEYVIGLRLEVSSEENLSESQIEELVLIQFQEKLIELGFPRNITMQLRNYRKINP